MQPPDLEGRAAFIFAEPDFDVDRILGFDALRSHDPDAMSRALMRDFDPEFAAKVRPGDLLIGGRNFGYGHPHGPPMAAMRKLGIAGVIAESFAPLYFAGEIAAGFPQIACPGILDVVARWDVIAVLWNTLTVENRTQPASVNYSPLTLAELETLAAGGLIPKLRNAKR